MEPLQKQILNLTEKVDALYQVIEQLDRKMTQAISESSFGKAAVRETYSDNSDVVRYQFKGNINFNPEMEHKDVLVDDIYSDMNRQGTDKNITPEIQIQRLTAQLTAAYNRIAALEEQLLRERIH